MDCIFCAIIEGRAADSRVAEDAQVVAFMDLRQPLPGHVLVVPRRHVQTLHDLEPDEAGALMAMAVRVARVLREADDAPGLTLWQSNGDAAGQEVPHVHLHLQPRRPHDGLYRLYRNGVPTPTPRARLDELATALRARIEAAS